MRLRNLMTAEPLTVGQDVPEETVRRLMDGTGMHHMPIVEDDRLVGMWVATDAGPVVLLGGEEVQRASADDDAIEAVAALFDDSAVVALADGRPVGILTRTDVLGVVREGLAHDVMPATSPLVVRFVGPAGSGKTTLIVRTLARLSRWRAAAVDANPGTDPEAPDATTIVHAPAAHWRSGFRRAIERMGGVNVILVEDRDGAPEATLGLGEDVQVIVVTAAEVRTIDLRSLRDAQAVVITRPADAPGFDAAAVRASLRQWNRSLAVFAVGPTDADPGMATWQQWLEARMRIHRR